MSTGSLYDFLKYRPEIDGLRAIAVVAVVLYHAGIGCPGGFVGVDLFFVISGYLISSIIIRDMRNGEFSLKKFWTRRARRIFPAAVVVVLATLFAGWFLLLPEDLAGLGNSASAQTLFSSNVYFWRTTNYFGGANAEKPLLHFWSLAVEEQFYFLFPFALILLISVFKFQDTRGLILTVVGLALASLSLSVWGVHNQPFATFFLLPTRAWELLFGTFVALLPMSTIPKSVFGREMFSSGGLLVATVPIFVYDDTTLFPGLAAVPTCLGSCAFIWANARPNCQTLCARILSQPAVVFIGAISYSLYLWHWPVIAFCTYWRVADFSIMFRLSMVGMSFLISVASWRYIESPFRRPNNVPFRTSKASLVTVATISLVALFVGLSFSFNDGFPNRMPLEARQSIESAARNERDREVLRKFTNDLKFVPADLPLIGSDSASRISFAVFGDSHAKAAAPIFNELGNQYGVSGIMVTHNATPPLLEWTHRRKHAAASPAILWSSALDYVTKHNVKHVFLVAYWRRYEVGGRELEFQNAMENTIEKLHAQSISVHVVHDTPSYEYDVFKASLRQLVLPFEFGRIESQTPTEHYQKNQIMFNIQERSSLCEFADPAPFLLDRSSNTYRTAIGGESLYRDADHMTKLGARIAIGPAIEPAFKSISKELKDCIGSSATSVIKQPPID